METSHRIALLSAGLLIGAQVGATVLSTETSDALPEPIAAEAEMPDTATPAEVAEAGGDATPTSEAAPDLLAGEQPILPVTPRHIEPQGSSPPPWGEDYRRMLPSLAEYLDRTEHLRVTGAPGGVFPMEEERMLPSLAEYLERREAMLIAQAQPPVATEPVAAVAIPAAGSEVTLLETGSPLTAGSPF
jgi:hypothetical protein